MNWERVMRLARNYGLFVIIHKMSAPSKIRQLLMCIATHAKTTKGFDRVAKEVEEIRQKIMVVVYFSDVPSG